MFRPITRLHQQLSQEECIEMLKTEGRGVLSILGDNGYPYGVPMDFWYSEDEDIIYFQGAKEGHKIDAIKNYNKASFCIYCKTQKEESGENSEEDAGPDLKSVIIFGRIEIVKDDEKTIEICRKLNEKFNFNDEYIEQEIEKFANLVTALKLTTEYMTGKWVNES